jgi:phosphoserine phosphatase RsbU/P
MGAGTGGTGGVVSDTARGRADLAVMSAALDALPEGVIVFGPDWTIRYVNRAAADLMDRRPESLVDRNLWIAMPLLAGSIFHSFLLHAAVADHQVTWQGFHAPTNRWLNASAVRVGDLLHVRFHELADRHADDAPALPVEPGAGDGRLGSGRERLRFLAEVSEALISTLDTGESAQTLAELVVGRLCDWAIVSVRGDDGVGADHALAHADPARLADVRAYLGGRVPGGGDESPMVQALLSGQPVQLTTIDHAMIEVSLGTDEARAAWGRLGTASCTIVPLRARGETFGALTLLNSFPRPPHTEMQIATAVEAARRGALALDNARLYGRQQRVAETLQRSLLSPPPHPDGLEIAVRYLPASTHMHVGGDWYDGIQQPDGATLLVIGDVVGHNVDAAAAMGQIRSIVRSIAYDRRESPARILARVDDVLTGLHIPTLATVLVARIEQAPDRAAPRRYTLCWSSAGHLPPLVLRPDGAVDVLGTPPEPLLGTGSVHRRSDHEGVLGPGDTLLLYTDGLVEHGRIDLDAGIARLTGVLSQLGDLSVENLGDQVLARILRHRSDDDIALIAVRGEP